MLEDLVMWLGFGLCHQLPERSYAAGGLQAPVCVRDTGIYVGFIVALVLVNFLHRGERPRGFPRGYVWAVMAGLIVLMGIDGVTSYAGLRETTNQIRLATGLGVGFAVAAMIAPMLNDELWRTPGAGRVLDPVWRFWVWIAAIPLTYLVIDWLGPRLGIAFPLLIAASIVATLTAVNLVIVAMLPAFDRRGTTWRSILAPAAIAVGVSFLEIALAAQLRTVLIHLTGSMI